MSVVCCFRPCLTSILLLSFLPCPALPAPSLSYPPHVLCQSLTKKYGEAPATVSLKEAREVRRSAQIGIGDAGDAAFAALVRSIGRLR